MSLILDQKNYVLEVLAVLSLGLLAKCYLADAVIVVIPPLAILKLREKT